jgi:hypothetical protein
MVNLSDLRSTWKEGVVVYFKGIMGAVTEGKLRKSSFKIIGVYLRFEYGTS